MYYVHIGKSWRFFDLPPNIFFLLGQNAYLMFSKISLNLIFGLNVQNLKQSY